jgi:hypothetical protein
MLRHELVAFARSLSWCAHLPHPGLHDLGTSAADMATSSAPSHSHTGTLYNRHPLHTISTYTFLLLREVWAW